MQTNLTGIRHALLVQLDADGSLNWGVDLGDSDATNLAVDGQGNVLVSGSFEDALDLGSGSLTDAGFGDIYIAKYSADGLLQWNKRAGGEDTEYSCLVSVDGQSNIYFAIESYSVNVDFAGTPAVTLPEGAGQLLLGKLNPDGDLQWVKSHGGTNVPGEESSCFATAIKTDSAGNTYMMGLFGRSNFFGNLLLTSPYAVNNFVAKFGPAGEPLWAKPIRMRRFGINYNELDIDVAGNCYPTGSIRDTVHFDNGLTLARQGTISDGFVAKYANADGNLEWVKTIWGGSIRPRGLAVYNEESLLLGGYFSGLLHYENETLDSRGGQNAFLGLLGPDIMVSADEPVDGLSMLRVYPNPSAGVFQLTTATPIPVDLEVLDTKGTILFRRSAVLTDQAIDLTALPAGVYFVKIMLAGRSEVKQVVIK